MLARGFWVEIEILASKYISLMNRFGDINRLMKLYKDNHNAPNLIVGAYWDSVVS
jgi:hypothetical protein